MTHHLLQDIEKKFIKKLPLIRPGYTVRIHQKIREGEKERVQVFEGLVMGFNAGHGGSKMMKVRKMVQGIGVEKTFPLYSPLVTKIEITKTPKVRRAKLFYMRELSGKATRLRAHVGLTAKDEKYSKKKADLMESMGVDHKAQAAAEAEKMESMMEAPAEGAPKGEAEETTAPQTPEVKTEEAKAPEKTETKAEAKKEEKKD